MSRVLELWQGMTGTVLPYALATAPSGWLICDGEALAPGVADTLRQKLIDDGNPYGVSGGNPRKPDLRGEFIRGLDGGRGVDTGRALGSAQADEIKAHDHTVHIGFNATTALTASPASTIGPNPGGNSFNTAQRGGTETRPRNVAMNYIIKT
jgi:microcystin-dependent protein